MSTVLSYNADKFKILICDTRITNNFNDSDDSSDSNLFNDSGLKIHYIDNYGFLTGVGVGQLMMYTFNGIKIPEFDSLHYSFQTAYEAIEKECNDEVRRHLEKTVVVVSTNDNVYLFSNNFKPIFSCDCITLHKNKLDIQFPLDFEQLENEKKDIFLSAESLSSKSTIDDVLSIMLTAFKKISSMSMYVSGTCGIAVLKSGSKYPVFTLKNAEEVSEIIAKEGFNGLNNEFEQYKTQLISWDHI